MALAVVGAAAGCGSDSQLPAPPPPVAQQAGQATGWFSDAAFPAYAVTAQPSQVQVYDSPEGQVSQELDNPVASGAPLTFLLAERQGQWLRVYLPVRPNGSTGWVRERDVVVQGVPFVVDVFLDRHELELSRGGQVEQTFPIGVGQQDTPTPGGVFYLKELLEVERPSSVYGPYAYGLSGFQPSLPDFNGGEGVVGLHGTNDPDSIGKDVSAGCIRLSNEDITSLTQKLPLGTPVRINA